MNLSLHAWGTQENAFDQTLGLPRLRRTYECRCGAIVFFRNSRCLTCQTALGYEPHMGLVVPLEAGTNSDTWRLVNDVEETPALYRRCANLNTAAACNWLVSFAEDHPFCICCRLDRTIPDLSVPQNEILWSSIEVAKRRVVSALVALGLPVASRVSEDLERGLAFDLLRPPPGTVVLTGHLNGLITLNIEEADNAKREQIRTQMREPYRTLVGHLRHEVGHYYWDRLVANSHWLDEFRRLFGDERQDYAAALRRNYAEGPRRDWQEYFVSSYASTHPWEDWAETWAHYMHMLDTLSTAVSVGLRPESVEMPFDAFSADLLYPAGLDQERFLSLLNAWLRLTAVLNELSRSMGQPDFYPFVLPRAAITKLHFIHTVIRTANPKQSVLR